MIADRLKGLEDHINAYELRERVLLCLSVLSLVCFLWYYLFYLGHTNEHEQRQKQADMLQGEIRNLLALQEVLNEALTKDPSAAKRKELGRYTQRLDELDNELNEVSVGLIPAKELVRVLHDVLPEDAGLTIHGARTYAPTNINFNQQLGDVSAEDKKATEALTQDDANAAINRDATDEAANAEHASAAKVYKHLVTLELSGTYFSVIAYLQRLENLPWRLYWQFLDYRVSDYPNAIIYVGVYTLSADKGRFNE